MKRFFTLVCALILVFALFGCGNKGIERQISQADTIIKQAEAEGADLGATVALQTAKDKLELAKQLLKENKTDSALTAAAFAVESAKEALATTRQNKSAQDGGR